jgi:hypothetical protein
MLISFRLRLSAITALLFSLMYGAQSSYIHINRSKCTACSDKRCYGSTALTANRIRKQFCLYSTKLLNQWPRLRIKNTSVRSILNFVFKSSRLRMWRVCLVNISYGGSHGSLKIFSWKLGFHLKFAEYWLPFSSESSISHLPSNILTFNITCFMRVWILVS